MHMAGPMTRQLGSAVSAATYSWSKTSVLAPIYKHTHICTESDYIKSKPDVVMARCQKCLLLYAQPAGARTATRSVGAVAASGASTNFSMSCSSALHSCCTSGARAPASSCARASSSLRSHATAG